MTMGAYSGAECCELVGLYILNLLVEKGFFPKGRVGLYRDDGLAAVEATGKAVEDMKKAISSLLKSMGLSLTYETNKTATDFLDVQLDLSKGEYKPYMKPGNVPLYINRKSNRPPNIIKNIPAAIN